MPDLKHVGRLTTNNRRLIVTYRVVPGDPDSCLVVHPETLDADQHDTLMKLVESNTGQAAYELGEAMARTTLPDGRNMLAHFHRTGKLNKYPSETVELTPNTASSVNLKELNTMIAEQRGVTIADLAIQPDQQAPKQADNTKAPIAEEPAVEPLQAATDTVLTDEELAAQYRSQADRLYKEAKRLREQAEELVPTKKRTATKKTKESAEE